MNEKRDAYVHTRVTERELRIIDTLARHLRRPADSTHQLAFHIGILVLPNVVLSQGAGTTRTTTGGAAEAMVAQQHRQLARLPVIELPDV